MPRTALDTRPYFYADYMAWPTDERWELLDGVAYNMAPAPTTIHQSVTGNLFGILFGLLRGHPCRVFSSPIDVLLPLGNEADEEVDTVVQPDILVTCRPDIVREKNLRGAPDWVIEVLSPATAKKDEGVKRDLYQRAGVKEYWLVHPIDHTLIRYRLLKGSYGLPDVFGSGDLVHLPVPDGAVLDLGEVFTEY